MANLISFHVVSIYRISAISTYKATLMLDSCSLCGVWSVPDSPPCSDIISLPKVQSKSSETIPLEIGNCYYFLSFLKSWVFHYVCTPLIFFSVFIIFLFFLVTFPSIITHQFPCKMPLLKSFKNKRKNGNLIKSMYLFPYCKWNANTEVMLQGESIN